MCHTIDCGCGHNLHHASPGACHLPVGYGHWRFPTREELIKELEGYLSYLQSEAKGVEERLSEIKKVEK
ncbi:MAG: hypothetical protein ACLFVK_07300 [Dehalococcoidia bacterium]